LISLHFPSTVAGILVYLVGLLVLWVIVSIPVYFAGKVLTGGRSGLGDAMGATLGGGIAYFVVFFVVSFFLGAVIGSSAAVFALLLALLVWLAVYKAAFRTSWIRAVGIVVLSWLILIIIDYAMVHVFGVTLPDFLPFS